MSGKVVPELLNQGEHHAVVKSVDRVIDAASNTFRVRLGAAQSGGGDSRRTALQGRPRPEAACVGRRAGNAHRGQALRRDSIKS